MSRLRLHGLVTLSAQSIIYINFVHQNYPVIYKYVQMSYARKVHTTKQQSQKKVQDRILLLR